MTPYDSRMNWLSTSLNSGLPALPARRTSSLPLLPVQLSHSSIHCHCLSVISSLDTKANIMVKRYSYSVEKEDADSYHQRPPFLQCY